MDTNQQFSLRWNNYLHHITDAFHSLREDENLVDVTLCCEGKKIKAHKMLLSACSAYFREIFKENPCQHPVIVFHNVKYDDLVGLVSFMYKGEVNVEQEGLSSFLNTAELLEVQGLSSGPTRTEEADKENSQENKPIRKQCSPKPQHRPDSPALKRRKVPTEESSPPEHKSPLSLQTLTTPIKSEPADLCTSDIHDETEDQRAQSLSLPLIKSDNSFSDENMDAASDHDAPAGSSSEVSNAQETFQVPSPVLHTCPECGKTFRHSGSLSMHKRLHIGDTYCVYCGRIFSRKYYLKLHMKMHHYPNQPLLPQEVPKTE